MNAKQIKALRDKLNAAHALDAPLVAANPMSTEAPAFDAAIAEIGRETFSALLACEEAIEEANLNEWPHRNFASTENLPELRGRVCAICSGRPVRLVHAMAEAIFSAAGLPDALAWDAGHVGVHIETENAVVVVK